MLRRPVVLMFVGVTLLGLAVVAWPQAVGLERAAVLAQVVSFRAAAGIATAVAAVLLIALGFVLHRSRAMFGVLAIVLLAFTGATAAILLARGIGAQDVPTAGRYDLTVLSWNTLGDSVPARAIARVARDGDADVITLPETTADRAQAVAALLADDGLRFRVFSASQQEGIRARSTSVLVRRSLGAYRRVTNLGDTHDVPSVVLEPSGGQNAPRIVAVHTGAPYDLDPAGWRDDLAWAARRCTGTNVLVAGDFNATLDHFAGLGEADGQLGDCRDGALATRNAAVGTWPSTLPALVGTPIDHVLATPNWRFTGFRVLTDQDSAGSDHRPVLARITPAG